jgi:hypothetical protein
MKYEFIAVALGCAILLSLMGDFTPYVGEPDRDIVFTPTSLPWQIVSACLVAMSFAAVAVLLFAMTGRLVTGFALSRFFLVTAAGLSVVVYIYGDFKMIVGQFVHYELPWGIARFAVSATCGGLLALIATAAVAPFCWSAAQSS